MLFFQISAHIVLNHKGNVQVMTRCYAIDAPELPEPSFDCQGNSNFLIRYFITKEKAKKYEDYVTM